MALKFILDGYNIIKSGAGEMFAAGTLEQQRKKLLDWLCDRQPQGSVQNTVAVVFDGKAEHPYWTDSYSEQLYHGIIVRYSEGASADDSIEAMVREDPLPADVVVVTNDKGLHRRLGGTGARWISVAAFMEKARGRHQGSQHQTPRGAVDGIVANDITEEMKKTWLK